MDEIKSELKKFFNDEECSTIICSIFQQNLKGVVSVIRYVHDNTTLYISYFDICAMVTITINYITYNYRIYYPEIKRYYNLADDEKFQMDINLDSKKLICYDLISFIDTLTLTMYSYSYEKG